MTKEPNEAADTAQSAAEAVDQGKQPAAEQTKYDKRRRHQPKTAE